MSRKTTADELELLKVEVEKKNTRIVELEAIGKMVSRDAVKVIVSYQKFLHAKRLFEEEMECFASKNRCYVDVWKAPIPRQD